MRASALDNMLMRTERLYEGSLSVTSRRSTNCSHSRWSVYDGDSTKYLADVSSCSAKREPNKYQSYGLERYP